MLSLLSRWCSILWASKREMCEGNKACRTLNFLSSLPHFLLSLATAPGADLGGGGRGVHPPPPPPWDDLRFSNTTGILQLSGTPPSWEKSWIPPVLPRTLRRLSVPCATFWCCNRCSMSLFRLSLVERFSFVIFVACFVFAFASIRCWQF